MTSWQVVISGGLDGNGERKRAENNYTLLILMEEKLPSRSRYVKSSRDKRD
jgi:hypothetical protein